MLIINDESEKHIRNLARCLNRISKPYEKLSRKSTFTLAELLDIKDLPQAEQESIKHDMFGEVLLLLRELGIDIEDYPGGYNHWEK